MRLGPSAQQSGFRVEAFESLGSTNDEAMARGRAGEADRLWIVAREQGQGRGRNGRVWSSPPGNLYASLMLRSACSPSIAPQIGFVAGLALHRAIAATCALAPGRLALKWPNDLLLDRAKLAGILVEGSTTAAGDLVVVIGIGVNIAHHPADTPYPATDLAAQGMRLGVEPVLAALSDAMAQSLARWNAGAGFDGVRRDWLQCAGGLGEPITVRRPDGDRRGIFVDLDPDGRLLLDEGTRRVAIDAGDVFLAALHKEFQ